MWENAIQGMRINLELKRWEYIIPTLADKHAKTVIKQQKAMLAILINE